ncbi:GNAT family N-acetyltransferase [Companilactobacillus sp. HBUAS56275]|uniref:GNAT family N-acetyltransferase n=1 Tax=Candidatus Companilactobacillus pullicola TaxID=2838523 RepID=A0A9D1ZPB7_9LACO|nr:GNAT family N-acetyltransferase [Candidatus Companilactobacillus pullicola]
MDVREANINDAKAIHRINSDSLEYDFPLDETTKQIEKILSLPNNKLFVACKDDLVVGYIQMGDYENTYHQSLKNVITLAVDNQYQHIGIGSALLEAAEKWAKSQGSLGIRLVSGFERESAHHFYEKHGYEIRKKEINYIKWW